MTSDDTEIPNQTPPPGNAPEQSEVWPPRPLMQAESYNGYPIPLTPQGFVSGTSLAQWILILLGVHIACNGIGLIGNFCQKPLSTILLSLAAVLEGLLFLVTGILFLVWTHRSYRNLTAFGAQGLHFSPGWAVGYFFVPFLNLVRPYQIFREIWQASEPAPNAALPSVWQSVKPPALLFLWWICWLLFTIISDIANRAWDNSNPGQPVGLFVTDNVVTIVAAVLAMQVVKGITTRQEQRATLIAA